MNPFDLIRGLVDKKNPFRELSLEEKKKHKETELAVKEGIKKLGLLCNDILLDQRYIEFANLFKDIESKILDLMIDLEEADRDKYYLRMSELQIKLRMFRQILRMPREFKDRREEILREEKKNEP